MARKPAARTPDVHRPLVVVDPPMEGRDVANLQRAIRARLRARGLGDDVPVPMHGRFTLATALACIEAQYLLGLPSETYLMRDAHGHRVVTEEAQRIIRRPQRRNHAQLDRAREREAQLPHRPRFYRDLGRELGVTGHGRRTPCVLGAAPNASPGQESISRVEPRPASSARWASAARFWC